MYGLTTRNEDETTQPAFDRTFYEVKDVTGRSEIPVAGTVSMLSCHADNRLGSEHPDLVPVTESGVRADREQRYFDWTFICPTATAYRDDLFDRIETAAAVTRDVRLDDVGFPRPEYCHCDRCLEQFEASDFEDWWTWRAAMVTDFVAAARDLVPGRLFMTLYPDPYPGHLYRRKGIELERLAELVDEFVVPLYDMAYETTYWLEILATGFQDCLDTPFSIELYAVAIEDENLRRAARVAGEYGESIVFAYDAEAGRRTVRALEDGADV